MALSPASAPTSLITASTACLPPLWQRRTQRCLKAPRKRGGKRNVNRIYGEPVEVQARKDGRPTRFVWRSRLYTVRAILEHWVINREWWRNPEGQASEPGQPQPQPSPASPSPASPASPASPSPPAPAPAGPAPARPAPARPAPARPAPARPAPARPAPARPAPARPARTRVLAGRGGPRAGYDAQRLRTAPRRHHRHLDPAPMILAQPDLGHHFCRTRNIDNSMSVAFYWLFQVERHIHWNRTRPLESNEAILGSQPPSRRKIPTLDT